MHDYSDLTQSQSFQPMVAQLSMESVLPLAKVLRQRHIAVVIQDPVTTGQKANRIRVRVLT